VAPHLCEHRSCSNPVVLACASQLQWNAKAVQIQSQMVSAFCFSNLRQVYLSFQYELPILTMGDLYYVDEVEKDQNGIPLGRYAVHKSKKKKRKQA
jgi:hypothetical protein